MKYITYIIFRFTIFLFSIIPFPILYLLSDLLCFVLQYIFRYRTDVIEKNIHYCFPKKTQREVEGIRKIAYKNFVDITLESFKGLSINPYKLIKRFRFVNPEALDDYVKNNQNVIVYSQHLNNWEWGPICLGLQIKHHIVGIVKQISNPYINKFIIEGRSGNNVSVIPTFKTGMFFSQLDSTNKNLAIVFIADQRPSGREKKVGIPFLGGQANFHIGAANYVIGTGYPVVSFDVKRKKRGYYEVTITPISSDTEKLSPRDLTELYISNLENLILESPASWLWTHKRFKEFIEY